MATVPDAAARALAVPLVVETMGVTPDTGRTALAAPVVAEVTATVPDAASRAVTVPDVPLTMATVPDAAARALAVPLVVLVMATVPETWWTVPPPVTACPSHDHAGSSQVTVASSQVAPADPNSRVRRTLGHAPARTR